MVTGFRTDGARTPTHRFPSSFNSLALADAIVSLDAEFTACAKRTPPENRVGQAAAPVVRVWPRVRQCRWSSASSQGPRRDLAVRGSRRDCLDFVGRWWHASCMYSHAQVTRSFGFLAIKCCKLWWNLTGEGRGGEGSGMPAGSASSAGLVRKKKWGRKVRERRHNLPLPFPVPCIQNIQSIQLPISLFIYRSMKHIWIFKQ